MYDGLVGELVEVVAVERDVEHAARQFASLDLRDLRAEPRRDRYAALTDADEHQMLRSMIFLYNLVRDAHEGAANAVLIHQHGLFSKLGHASSSFGVCAESPPCPPAGAR